MRLETGIGIEIGIVKSQSSGFFQIALEKKSVTTNPILISIP